MKTFRATAYNASGDTFQFTFKNPNWNGIDQAAKYALDGIVLSDKLHQSYGPWKFRNIDVTGDRS